MNFEAEVVCREIIKPASPTPKNLSTFKLSLKDQLSPRFYVPIILFYASSPVVDKKNPNLLKNSLSQTLSHMYPLSGRIKDVFSIECKDQGVEFVESRVPVSVSSVLNNLKIDQLKQLVPFDPEGVPTPENQKCLLGAQVNYFSCGGIAIGICINHIIIDFAVIHNFLKTWSAITRGEKIEDTFVRDCTTVFRPQDVSGFNQLEVEKGTKSSAKRFIFSNCSISALQKKMGKDLDQYPSRVVAVSTFVWAAIIATSPEKIWFMTMQMNLRNKMGHPEILQNSLGNITHAIVTSAGSETDYRALVREVLDSIQEVTPEFLKNLYEDENYFTDYKKAVEDFAEYSDGIGLFSTSSWCGFPTYEVDFGWGKPVQLGTTRIPTNCAFLMDTRDGKGIEVWVSLPEKCMQKLEKNADFLAHVSMIRSRL
ncbi:Vinorine synthase [Heracleum sosnowskyi]|uniref:Vinorine synthase n=1 Tax=Heracleum sosnowskyi TaxID=360622 RepID=A0AAD8HR46_9APIA|nr:Vinorine synthase [Heracleum sosnowskyi]